MPVANQVFKLFHEWKVYYQGRVCCPSFNSKGAAQVYLDMILNGQRKPEYGISSKEALAMANKTMVDIKSGI